GETVTVTDSRVPEALRPWLLNALYALESSGLAERAGQNWTLGDGSALPAPDEIMRWIAGDHPDLSAELVLIADVGALVDRLLAGTLSDAPALPQGAIDAFVLRSATARHGADVVADLIERSRAQLPKERALRVLQVGFGPLSAQTATFAAAAEARLTVFETDRRLAERARLSLGRAAAVVETAEELAPGSFDLILASGSLHRGDRALPGQLAGALATGGLLVAVEPGASLFRDLVFGLTAGWFEEAAGGLPVGRLEDIEGWQRILSAHGLVKVEVERAASANGDDLLLTAEAPVRPGPAPAQSFAFIIGSDDEFAAETASSLATLLVAGGVHVSIILDSETSLMELEKETPDTVVFLAGAFTRGGEAAERLRDRCLSLKRCTEHLGSRQTRLWVVAPGATRDRGGQTTNIEAGVWAFSRTLANEAPNLDVRRIDLSPEMSSKRASERLLEADVPRPLTRHDAARRRGGAVSLDRLPGGVAHPRMAVQAEVVVGREVGEALLVDPRHGPGLGVVDAEERVAQADQIGRLALELQLAVARQVLEVLRRRLAGGRGRLDGGRARRRAPEPVGHEAGERRAPTVRPCRVGHELVSLISLDVCSMSSLRGARICASTSPPTCFETRLIATPAVSSMGAETA
ncbi:hypothetical protein OMR07_27835, partial [Methylobacterium organophilum]|nr:hypothetical protein [Methylobacterium organophilum]